jgi:hypothetical protein
VLRYSNNGAARSYRLDSTILGNYFLSRLDHLFSGGTMPSLHFVLCICSALFLSLVSPAENSTANAWTPGADLITQNEVSFHASDPDARLQEVVLNIKHVFERFRVVLDSSTHLVSPLQVTGSNSHPSLKASVEKCVLFVCKTVDLDGEITVHDLPLTSFSRSCHRLLQLEVDLRRSSPAVTDIYEALKFDVCYRSTQSGSGHLSIQAFAEHAPRYQGGFMQTEAFSLLKLQIDPILQALQQTLSDANEP